MKRLKLIAASLAMVALAAVPMLPVFAADNLLANQSVETTAGSQPAHWRADRWGNNEATHAHANEGYTGSKSLRIEMTSHADGDAKWMADPVNVAADAIYTYSSYYKANVATEIDLQYTHQDGSITYDYVQYVPPSATWESLKTEFKTPATAKQVVVLHVIAESGWLQTDEFDLRAKVETPPVEEENLIANSSFEDAVLTEPQHWNKNKWGDITANFSYNQTGRTGNRSASVTVTQQSSGDAKWYANPVAVQAGKSYLYRDFYKSTVDSRVVVAFIDAQGNYSYSELEGAAASGDWKQYQVTFAVPANAVKATIFHLVDRVGTLTIDDTLLQVALPTTPTQLVPNGSLEAVSGTNPASWQHNSWGQNNASFTYANEGRSGSKSIKTTVTNFQSGDAKWFFEPISTLTPGKQYRFSTWYKTNALPKAVVLFIKADGTEQYIGMPAPQPGVNAQTEWQQYTDTFTVPEGVVSVSAFLMLAQNGWLQTDDYNLAEYHPKGFNRPLLSLTFDDGHEDNARTALPLLNQYGFKSTQCYATTFIEGKASAVRDVRAFQDAGHEICSHTVTHPFLTSLNMNNLHYELQHSRQYLESITGQPIDNFATPYGDYNPSVNNVIKQYYGSHRTVDEGFNSKDNFDKYRLRVQNILDTTSAAQVRQWIEQAQADNTWLILVYHRVANDPGPYDSYTNVFAEQLEVMRHSGIEIKTYKDALAEVTSQL